jgi:hypothetical protein
VTSHPGRYKRLVLVAVGLVLSLGVVACNDADAEVAVTVAELPEDLCQAIPSDIVARWHLADDDFDFDTSSDERRSIAACTMSGEVDGKPVSLAVSLIAFGGEDRDAVRTRMADALADRCAELQAAHAGRFRQAENRCSAETGRGPDRGQVTEVSRSVPSYGVVTVAMDHSGPQWRSVAPDVVAISGTLANAGPADLPSLDTLAGARYSTAEWGRRTRSLVE